MGKTTDDRRYWANCDAQLLALWVTFCFLCVGISPATLAAAERIAPSLATLTTGFHATAAEDRAGATVINHVTRVSIQSDGNSVQTEYLAVTLLDDKAVDAYRQVSRYFNSYFTTARLDFARVIDRQGRSHDVSVDGIQTQSPGAPYMIDDQRILTFALPGLERGATLEYQVTYASKPKLDHHWFGYETFNLVQWATGNSWPRIDPVRSASVTVEAPVDQQLHFESVQKAPAPIRVTRDGRTTYRWEMQTLPAVVAEANMHSLVDQLPHVEITTIPDWRIVDAWGKGVYLTPVENSPLAKQTAAKLVTLDMTPRQRMETLFYYVEKNIRYIDAHLSRGGYAPHASDEVLKNRYGDCKDQAVLLVALLRAAGITAFPALTNRLPGSDPHRTIAALNFSHMIVYVPGASGVWLDTTGAVAQYPGIDSSLDGAMAFVIDGSGGRLLTIPHATAEQNTVTLRVVFSYDKEAIAGHAALTSSGVLSDRMKAYMRSDQHSTEKLQGLVRSMYPAATDLNVNVDSTLDSNRPFAFTASFDFAKSWTTGQDVVNFGGDLSGLLALFTPLVNLPPADGRHYDYDVGMPMRLTMTVHCPAPTTEYRPVMDVQAQALRSSFFSTHYEQQTTADGVDVISRFTLPKSVIDQPHYAEFVSDVRDSLKQSSWRLSFHKDANYAKEAQLQHTMQTNGRSVDALLAMAHHEISTANYAAARDLAREAIAKDPGRGEAHYLLGISLGFLDDYTASDQALKKAKTLGYQP